MPSANICVALGSVIAAAPDQRRPPFRDSGIILSRGRRLAREGAVAHQNDDLGGPKAVRAAAQGWPAIVLQESLQETVAAILCLTREFARLNVA